MEDTLDRIFGTVDTKVFSVRYCGTNPELLQTIGNVKVTLRAGASTIYEYTPMYRVAMGLDPACSYTWPGYPTATDRKVVVDEIEIDNPVEYPVNRTDLTDWQERD